MEGFKEIQRRVSSDPVATRGTRRDGSYQNTKRDEEERWLINDRARGIGKMFTGYWHFDYQTLFSIPGLGLANHLAFRLPGIGISITNHWHIDYQPLAFRLPAHPFQPLFMRLSGSGKKR
jgi:hypothetical protein